MWTNIVKFRVSAQFWMLTSKMNLLKFKFCELHNTAFSVFKIDDVLYDWNR